MEASGDYSHAEGYFTTASSYASHAEGNVTTASGGSSHAEGDSTIASGDSSHAEGAYTTASGEGSHAEGNNTTASGYKSHAEGGTTTASGYASHAEGFQTKASGDYQHVQGKFNIEDTANKYAHIVGNGNSETSKSNAHTLDWKGNAWYAGDVQANNVPHVISERVVVTVPAASISAKKTEIDNAAPENAVEIPVDGTVTFDSTKSYYVKYNNVQYSALYDGHVVAIERDGCYCGFMTQDANTTLMIVALDTTNITDMQLIEKDIKKLDNMYMPNDLNVNNSITVGTRNGEIGVFSSSFGLSCEASGVYSHAEGIMTIASGRQSHAEGYGTTASGDYSHAEGDTTTASAYSSHAEGKRTTASGQDSHAEGYGNTASGHQSHAEGCNTTASGDYSHAEGERTIASGQNQHVQGKYNIEDTANKYAHIVGNGSAENNKSNAHTLDWEGNAWYAGDVQANNIPHVVSEKVVLTIPAATISAKKTEIDNATPENVVQINVEGATAVVYDSTKSYYIKYNNKEYYASYNLYNFLIW